MQVLKDVALLGEGEEKVGKVIWYFFPSPVTGLSGPSGPLMDMLLEHNMEFWIW